MADEIVKVGTAIPGADGGSSPTPADASTQEQHPENVAELGLTPEFLDDLGYGSGAEAEPIGDEANLTDPKAKKSKAKETVQSLKEKEAAKPKADAEAEVDPVQAEIARAEAEALAANTTPETEEEPDAEPTAEEKAADPKWYQKRVDKLAAQKHEARAEAAKARADLETERASKVELESKLTAAASRPPVVDNSSGPFSDVFTSEELNARVQHANQMFQMLEEAPPEGGTFMVGSTKYEISEEAAEKWHKKGVIPEPTIEALVKGFRANALSQITAAPAREKWITENKAQSAEATRAYPNLHKTDHADHAARNALLKRAPGLAAIPDFDLFIGDALRGKLIREEEGSNKAIYKRFDLEKIRSEAAKAKANGNGTAHANGDGKTAPTKKLSLPPISSSTRAPVTQAGADPGAAVWRKAAAPQGVSLEEMADSGAIR